MKVRNKIKSDFFTLFLRNLNSKCTQYIILSLLMTLILQVSCYVPQDLHGSSADNNRDTIHSNIKRNVMKSNEFRVSDNNYNRRFHSSINPNAQLRTKRHAIAYSSCPTACYCASATTVFCQGTDYESLKLFFSNGTTIDLSLEKVSASILDSTSFENMVNLENLKLIRGGIQNLKDEVFVKNSKLVTLDISNNEIEDISNSTFKGLSNLKSLNLSYNQLQFLPQGVFQDLRSIQQISISNNKFQILPFGVFDPIKSFLSVIDLSKNKIVSIQDDFFTFAPNVKKLLLNDNQIHKLALNTFNDLEHLEYLDLANNNLNELYRNVFNKLSSLNYLNLSRNKIVGFSYSSFKNLINLEVLNFNSNPLRNLTRKAFQNCKNLETLYLSNTSITQLSDYDLYGLDNLKILEINNNKNLTKMDRFVFDWTPNLEVLSVSNSKLTYLSESVKNLKNLSTLSLMPNPLICDCRTLWFSSFVENYPRDLNVKSFTCHHEGIAVPTNLLLTLKALNCQPPVLINKTETKMYKLRSEAYLDCNFKGSPHPSITWVTPNLDVYHYNPDVSLPGVFIDHYPAHHSNLSRIVESSLEPRLEVLDNGTLRISDVLRLDAGVYTCLASNPVSNVTTHVTLHIDPIFMYDNNKNSFFFGGLSAAGFLTITLVFQLIKYLLRK